MSRLDDVLGTRSHTSVMTKAGIHSGDVAGMNNDLLVDLRAAFSSMSPQTRRLLAMADEWAKDPLPLSADGTVSPSYRPKQQPSLAQRLTEADIQTLIQRYRNGVTGRELAEYYGCSLSTVKRLLRARGVRVNK